MPLASTPPTTRRTAFNSLISGCALHALPAACFALFRRMRAAGVPFDVVTLMTLLPAAPQSVVSQLHALAGKAGLAAETNVGNCLISAYARRGAGLGRQVFDEMPLTSHDIVSWNAVLSSHAQNGLAGDALDLYNHMCGHDGGGVEPDVVMLVGMLPHVPILESSV
uniref:Pentatricopeptide repeat-containing protein n=1 Tax=Triticum urartu TaxID=4572 RepID=A0A8R7TZH8_TRIUA